MKYFMLTLSNMKKIDYHLMKGEFKLVFNDNQNCPYVTSELHSNKTMSSWYIFLESVISEFKDKGYNFNHITELNIRTIVNNLDISYEF